MQFLRLTAGAVTLLFIAVAASAATTYFEYFEEGLASNGAGCFELDASLADDSNSNLDSTENGDLNWNVATLLNWARINNAYRNLANQAPSEGELEFIDKAIRRIGPQDYKIAFERSANGEDIYSIKFVQGACIAAAGLVGHSFFGYSSDDGHSSTTLIERVHVEGAYTLVANGRKFSQEIDGNVVAEGDPDFQCINPDDSSPQGFVLVAGIQFSLICYSGEVDMGPEHEENCAHEPNYSASVADAKISADATATLWGFVGINVSFTGEGAGNCRHEYRNEP